jgi:hypothetical protein
MTQAEADAANLLYPVPPYGPTYIDPNGPPEPPVGNPLTFVVLTNIQSQAQHTFGTLRPGDAEKLAGRDTIVIWPISGRAGVLRDLPARSVRIQGIIGDQMRFNLDTGGLNLTDLSFLGALYVGD